MKQLREITRKQRVLPLGESKDPINADCRLLQLHADMTDDEKEDLIAEFVDKLLSIKHYDVFLLAVW